MLKPVKKEKVKSKDFAKIVDRNFDNIASTRFIIPRIGSGSFGHFEIEYKTPVLKDVRSESTYA